MPFPEFSSRTQFDPSLSHSTTGSHPPPPGSHRTTDDLENTPIKPSLRTAARAPQAEKERQEISESLLYGNKPLDLDQFFGSISISDPVLDVPFTALTDFITKAETEEEMYKPICTLLNTISKEVLKGMKPAPKPLVFRFFPDTPLKSWGSSEYILKPDFGCHRGTKTELGEKTVMKDPPAWPLIDGVGEAKLNLVESDLSQVVHYLRANLEQRPDKHSVIGIHATRKSYVLLRLDSLQLSRTEALEWSNHSPLIKYVQELYSAPRDLSMNCEGDFWSVTFCGAKYEAYPVATSKPPGRRSWIAIAVDLARPEKLVIVKDIWRDKDRSHLEGDLLDEVHKEQAVPGVVECVASGDVNCPAQFFASAERTTVRQKYRIVLGQVGFPLSTCSSTLEFLKFCVDTVQIHLKCLKNGVLHRDLGWPNLLRCPKKGTCGVEWGPSDGLLFIDFVINGDKGVELSFAKVSVADYKLFTQKSLDPRCFKTEPDAKVFLKLYGVGAGSRFKKHLRKVFRWVGKEDLDKEEDSDDALDEKEAREVEEMLRVEAEEEDPNEDLDPPTMRLVPNPRHDMEGLFWSIALHTCRSKPLPPPKLKAKTGSESSTPSPEATDIDSCNSSSRYSIFCHRMLQHTLGGVTDPRAEFRKYEPYHWREILHPTLRQMGLGAMLSAMGQYLALPWEEFPGESAYAEHANDMMTFVLLNGISRILRSGTNVSLDNQPRPLPVAIKSALGIRSSVTRHISKETARLPVAVPDGVDETHRVSHRQRVRQALKKLRGGAERWYELWLIDNLWFM